MKIEFLPIAEIELDKAFQWYVSQQSNLGLKFLDEINQSLKRIAA